MILKLRLSTLDGKQSTSGFDGKEHLKKVSHSAIEKKRRDKINEKLLILKEIIPETRRIPCKKLQVLEYAVDYIQNLQTEILNLQEKLSTNSRHSYPSPVLSVPADALLLLAIHLTDLHLDPFYLANSDPNTQCHRGQNPVHSLKKWKKRKIKKPKRPFSQNTHYFGASGSICDSPMQLLNKTFEWIDRKVASKVDFVIWTGDSSRHDRDESFKREEKEAFIQNRLVLKLIRDTFDVPVVPSIGNWDTWPQNLMPAGPNKILKELWYLWEPLFPSTSTLEGLRIYQSFSQGGYFYREVVPDYLAIISLNTLYWFKDNSLVDDCDTKGPGQQQIKWLIQTLQQFKSSGLKTIIIGHVPPITFENEVLYRPNCYKQFVQTLGLHSESIVGHFYGHTNKNTYSFLMSSTNSSEYELTSLNLQTLESIDLKSTRLKGIIQQSPSIVPVYNPGYQMVTMQFSGTSDAWIDEQTLYYLDIERYNDLYDKSSEPIKFEFNGKGCSTKLDFNLANFTESAITEWISTMQFQGIRYKRNPVRKYFECLEIHTSDIEKYTRIDDSTVIAILSAGTVCSILFMAWLFFLNREILVSPEHEPLLSN